MTLPEPARVLTLRAGALRIVPVVVRPGDGWLLAEAAAETVLALAAEGLEPCAPAHRRAAVLWGCHPYLRRGR